MGFGKKRSSKVGVGAITTNKKKLFAEGGMMDDGKDVDPVSGNDVPTGSLAEEVRDDVDAKLSPGEFVFPADVVRFIGLERLMKMRDEAKKGLSRMNDIGQMGNAEEVGEEANDTYENEDEFESEIDDIMDEIGREESNDQTEMAFNTGGFVNPSYYDLTKAPKNPALDIRYFNDAEGKTFYMPFINGKPMKPMPNGAVQTGAPTGGITGGDGKKTIPTTPASSSDLKDFGKGLTTTGIVTATGSITPNLDAQGKTGTTTADSTKAGAGSSVSVAGTYTGDKISDFGRSDLIYDVGGSGKANELVLEDLWQSNASKWQVNLGSAALSTLAAAMGVPGILTLGFRAAVNKYGLDAVNKYFARANQEAAAKAGGIDINAPGGVAAAASQIDQLRDRGDTTTAASAGATGTGGRAEDAGRAVAETIFNSLKYETADGSYDIRASSSEEYDAILRGIQDASQEAVNAVLRGANIGDAVSKAISDYQTRTGQTIPTNAATGLGDEGSLYNGDGSFNPLNYEDLNQLSTSIGFDWATMGDTSPKTPTSPLTTTPDWMRYTKKGDEKFFTDIPDAFTLAGASRLLERFETDEQRQN